MLAPVDFAPDHEMRCSRLSVCGRDRMATGSGCNRREDGCGPMGYWRRTMSAHLLRVRVSKVLAFGDTVLARFPTSPTERPLTG